MKNLFTLIFVLACISAGAQNGPGIVFRHNLASGYREVREFDHAASLAKPGKDSTGQQADTVIGYFPEDDNEKVLNSRIFVRAYPNPVQDILIVENLSWKEGSNATLKIYDVSGKVIMEKTTVQPKETIQMKTLPPGNYYVKYYTNFTFLTTLKITKI